MAQQASQVTAKMQGVLNNRDTEIMQRKAKVPQRLSNPIPMQALSNPIPIVSVRLLVGPRKVHKRLARHVARTCQARRRLCKVCSRGQVLISGAVAAVGFVAAACVHFFPPPRWRKPGTFCSGVAKRSILMCALWRDPQL